MRADIGGPTSSVTPLAANGSNELSGEETQEEIHTGGKLGEGRCEMKEDVEGD